jgi:hypothetical protein
MVQRTTACGDFDLRIKLMEAQRAAGMLLATHTDKRKTGNTSCSVHDL